MQMHEPEFLQQERTSYQENQEYQEGFSGRYQQNRHKIYPTERRGLWIVTRVLSCVSFFFALIGTIASANVVEQCLRFAYQSTTLAWGIIGLVGSSLLLLL